VRVLSLPDTFNACEVLTDRQKRAWLIEHCFLRYGAGSHLLRPLTRGQFWNAFCWTMICLGVVGWGICFYLIARFAE